MERLAYARRALTGFRCPDKFVMPRRREAALEGIGLAKPGGKVSAAARVENGLLCGAGVIAGSAVTTVRDRARSAVILQ